MVHIPVLALTLVVATAVALSYPEDLAAAAVAVPIEDVANAEDDNAAAVQPAEGETIDGRHHYNNRRPSRPNRPYRPNYSNYNSYQDYGYNKYHGAGYNGGYGDSYYGSYGQKPIYQGYNNRYPTSHDYYSYGVGWREGEKPSDVDGVVGSDGGPADAASSPITNASAVPDVGIVFQP